MNTTADNLIINFVTERGDQIKVECAPSDSVLKLKHKLFIEKDLPVAKQVICKTGQQLDDKTLVQDLNLPEGEALQVTMPETLVIESNSMYDVVRKHDECFLRYKDDKGAEVYKQFGVMKPDEEYPQKEIRHLLFKNKPNPSIKDLLLTNSLVFYQLPDFIKHVPLTLSSHPGQALCIQGGEFKPKKGGLGFVELGPKEDALWVYIEHHRHGDFIKLYPKDGELRMRGNHFDVSKHNYSHDNGVTIWEDHEESNQWFVVNDDRTISPSCSPHLVWAWADGSLRIRKRGSEGQLVFDSLEPSFQPCHYMKLTLQSHPGKGIVFTGESRQHRHGLEEFITLGNADDAESIFLDDLGHIHSKTRPCSVFDGHDHASRDLEFFPNHQEYGHQKFTINKDGTISFNPDPNWVLGTDEAAKRVKFVKKGSEHQFIFDQAEQYLTNYAKDDAKTLTGLEQIEE